MKYPQFDAYLKHITKQSYYSTNQKESLFAKQKEKIKKTAKAVQYLYYYSLEKIFVIVLIVKPTQTEFIYLFLHLVLVGVCPHGRSGQQIRKQIHTTICNFTVCTLKLAISTQVFHGNLKICIKSQDLQNTLEFALKFVFFLFSF
eukprot:TRINITY_DN2536_c2_g1_i7.p5 TRINITY_DN2536_c2_g1~~TRINITY_DN2536_c2_g1_i7.p5  ORF type:complete len:145 (+),score=3.07 TRINITY_DN2536_c2_g1_i7:1452-1886(+)